jgi:hypothetical protein
MNHDHHLCIRIGYTPFLRIHLVPRLRMGSKAHLANIGAAPNETPIRTGSNACMISVTQIED